MIQCPICGDGRENETAMNSHLFFNHLRIVDLSVCLCVCGAKVSYYALDLHFGMNGGPVEHINDCLNGVGEK